MKIIEPEKIAYIFSISLAILALAGLTYFLDLRYSKAYIEVDGIKHIITPYKNISLKTVLEKNRISLSKDDIVSKDIDNPIKPLQTAIITRVVKENKKIVESVPFRMTWSRNYNSNLRKTQLQKGIEKTVTKYVEDTYHNGKLYHREVLKERSIAKEFYRLALLNDENKVEKFYDLSKAKRMDMVATAYYPGDPLAWGDGTVTFLGQKMQRGIIAVDPKIIPLRTRLFVSGYGYGYAGDTGNLIKGNRVDLGVNNVEEEQSWMFRDVVVYILEPSNEY